MSAAIIDGTALAREVRADLLVRVLALKARGIVPGLAFVLVGNNPASEAYVRGKVRGCAELGIFSETIRPPADAPLDALLNTIADLNNDPRYHGIIVQTPLPDGLDELAATGAVDPAKDVDGLTPESLGRLLRGDAVFAPATPAAVQLMLARGGYETTGKHVVIVGRSNLVGKPLAMMLVQKAQDANATVTVCHTATPDLGAITRTADILIVSTGRPRTVTGGMVKPGAVVIDVGVNRIADPSKKSGERLVGDVDFAGVAEVAGAITPVPGGVGPMTVTMLLANTVRAAELSPAMIDPPGGDAGLPLSEKKRRL
jgi:methylenetetrahydrofolate dehydrogenase (NADP+)/methenyltetrahydrofolate cyclohydrolase